MAFVKRRITKTLTGKGTRARGDTGEYRYDVHWRLGGADQQQKTFLTRKAADAFRAKVEVDEAAGLVTAVSRGSVPLKDFAEEWVDGRLTKGHPLAPSTKVGYRRLLTRNVYAKVGALTLGKMPLRAVTPELTRTWYTAVSTEASGDQAAKTYRLLHAIFETAVDDTRIGRNPFRIEGGGKEQSEERPFIPIDDVLELIDAMENRYRIVLVLAGMGSLRTGESMGLRTEDVDLNAKTVHVRQEAQEIAGLGRVVSDPKSEAGKRTVSLPDQAMRALADHLIDYPPAPDGSIVTAPRGGPARRAAISKAWIVAKAAVGVDPGLRIHDLRHHCATMMARMPGITTKELMAHIGHSSFPAAIRYQHASAERDKDVADFLEAEIQKAQRAQREKATEAPPGNIIPLFPLAVEE